MNSAMRELFPQLPPELRNEVYTYLSTPESPSHATTFGLPLKLKTFECKHTTVQICPVHHESNALLSLGAYRFQEAIEYNTWLLNNATELRIGIAFKGRVDTFIQQDWDRKTEAHLRKLVKLHPWLKKVAKYDVQVLWSPLDGVMKSRKKTRTAGQIVRDITATLTSLADERVKTKRGEINLKLCLDHAFAVETVISRTKFGFADVLTPPKDESNGFRKQTRELWKEARKAPEVDTGSRFLPIPPMDSKQHGVIATRRDSVRWTVGTEGHSVIRKCLVEGEVTFIEAETETEKDSPADYIALTLLGECL
jgi:hypothetical protein